MQDRLLQRGMDAFGQRGLLEQRRGMLAALHFVHLVGHDLAAVQVEDQVQVNQRPVTWLGSQVTSQHQTWPGWVAVCVVGARRACGG